MNKCGFYFVYIVAGISCLEYMEDIEFFYYMFFYRFCVLNYLVLLEFIYFEFIYLKK